MLALSIAVVNVAVFAASSPEAARACEDGLLVEGGAGPAHT